MVIITTQKRTGFTLIELLIVFGIIGVISTLTMVFFTTARMSSRDTKRLSDVKQIQLALKTYYNDLGYYPSSVVSGGSIANGGTNYLLRVPTNPSPKTDNNCPNEDYVYTQLESGQRYSLSFCLGTTTDDLDAGTHVATANGILNCSTGYVAIPGSYTFNTNDFCVMKWEAKCAATSDLTIGLTFPATSETTYDNGTTACTVANSKSPVSVSSGYPIANIRQTTAITYCNNLGGHLLTNPEWMTIVRNLEQVETNWSGGTVGSGYLNIGNYNTTDAMDGSLEYGAGGVTSDYKRTLVLSSGETIWDLGANVAESLATTCTSGSGLGNYVASTGSFIDWDDATLDDYERGVAGPSDDGWTSTEKIGQYNGCTTANQFLRGGLATDTIEAGIFGLDLNNDTGVENSLYGFRCVK